MINKHAIKYGYIVDTPLADTVKKVYLFNWLDKHQNDFSMVAKNGRFYIYKYKNVELKINSDISHDLAEVSAIYYEILFARYMMTFVEGLGKLCTPFPLMFFCPIEAEIHRQRIIKNNWDGFDAYFNLDYMNSLSKSQWVRCKTYQWYENCMQNADRYI